MNKTYEVLIHKVGEEPTSHFIQTDAEKVMFQKAIDFVALGAVLDEDKSIEKVLTAVRVLGNKAREIKVQAEETFDL